MKLRGATGTVLALLVLVACGGGTTPAPSPTPTPGPALTTIELKLALIQRLGPLWFCDPDFYPVAHEDEQALALERWAEISADPRALAALAGHLGLGNAEGLNDVEKLEVYRLWKQTNAIVLDPIGQDSSRFDYLAQPAGGAAQGTRTAGTIAADGTITVQQEAAAGEPICPICLARGTTIDTPTGPVAVETLRIGDRVWSLDGAGRLVEVEVVAIGSVAAPATHRVVRLTLDDGRAITASPGHQLGDGRSLGDLRRGDLVDGARVVETELVAYRGGRTFDIAVGGSTGLYLSGGIALRSTLMP